MNYSIQKHYKEVSLRLNKVLDTVGLREDIRWKRINMWIQSEEMHSVRFGSPFHYFGSQAEATTTPGLQSDIDFVNCSPFSVIKDLESWVPGLPTLLTVSDKSTYPGYVKLQRVHKDQPMPAYHIHGGHTKLDRYARSVLCNDGLKFDNAHEHHGPANSTGYGIFKIDYVVAMRLHAWPEQSSQWLTRNRWHNWPSQETINLVHETGALLVPVGHKLSEEKHLEWRLSMSFGEKLLVWLFNPTQYKCFILLKMINKCFIKPVVGDDVLSSYHCKTCMFYIIENTPAAMWQPDNLLQCADWCLKLLYRWIESNVCPNYFIPEENMFQCKVYGHIQGQLLCVLSNLLRQEGRYLVGISCDNIGQKLMMSCQVPVMELELRKQDCGQVVMVSVVFLLHSIMTYVVNVQTIHCTLGRAFSSRGPRREVNTILRTFYCSILGSKLASNILSQESLDQHGVDMAHELLLWGSSSDVASGKLKLAAFYLVQDSLDISADVLNEIHEKYSYKISEVHNISQHMLQEISSKNLSTTQMISQYTAFWVLYHTSEIKCTPKALIPEMFPFTMTNQGDPYNNCQENLVSVDPKFYLYFLEFVCYHRQYKRSHKEAALDNMICAIRHEDLAFMDTDLNLLAYCLMQEGKLMKAYNVLCKSMKLPKQHKAAIWHIALLINAAFRFLRRGE